MPLNMDAFGNRLDEPSTALMKPTPALPPRRPLNSIQDVAAEPHPGVTRAPTVQSIRGRSRENLGRVMDGLPPQLDEIIPGPPFRKETTLNTDSVHDDIARNLAAVRDREKELSEAMDEQTMQIQELQNHIQVLSQSHTDNVAKIADLEAQLRDEKGQNAKLTQAWKRSTAALGQAQRQEANYKVDDKALQGLYQELVFNIGNWADNHCIPDMKHLSDSEFTPFLSLTLVPDKYLRHKRTQPLLLKSLVMKMLVKVVFTVSSDTGMWWAGERGSEIRTIYSTLQPGTSSECCYADWALTTSYL